MGCCACCLNEDQKVEVVLRKFKMLSLGRCEPNPTMPQLCCGRIAPVPQPLIAPISGNACVYYTVTAQEWVERTNSEGGSQGNWEFCFEEARTVNFYVQDGNSFLFVSSETPVRRCDAGIAITQSGAGAVNFFQHEQLPPRLQELLDRHNFKVEYNVLVGFSKRKMRYLEKSFEIGDMLGVFGIIEDAGVTPYGQPSKGVKPVGAQSLTAEYFKANKWSGFEKEAWKALVGRTPAVLLADDPKLMAGITIPPVVGQGSTSVPGFAAQQPISPAPMPMLSPQYMQPPQYAQQLPYGQPQYGLPYQNMQAPPQQYAQQQQLNSSQPHQNTTQNAQAQLPSGGNPQDPPQERNVMYLEQRPEVVLGYAAP